VAGLEECPVHVLEVEGERRSPEEGDVELADVDLLLEEGVLARQARAGEAVLYLGYDLVQPPRVDGAVRQG